MYDTSGVETLGVALFETVGMPVRNLTVRTYLEYMRDFQDLLVYLAQHSITHVSAVCRRDPERYLAALDCRGLEGLMLVVPTRH